MLAAMLALFCTTAAGAAEDAGTPIPKGSTVYVEEIEGGLDLHIVAAIFMSKKRLPLKLVAVAEGADYYLRGTFLSVTDGGSSAGYGAVSLITPEGTIIWAAAATASSDRGTGVMAVAREIVKGLESVVEKN